MRIACIAGCFFFHCGRENDLFINTCYDNLIDLWFIVNFSLFVSIWVNRFVTNFR